MALIPTLTLEGLDAPCLQRWAHRRCRSDLLDVRGGAGKPCIGFWGYAGQTLDWTPAVRVLFELPETLGIFCTSLMVIVLGRMESPSHNCQIERGLKCDCNRFIPFALFTRAACNGRQHKAYVLSEAVLVGFWFGMVSRILKPPAWQYVWASRSGK